MLRLVATIMTLIAAAYGHGTLISFKLFREHMNTRNRISLFFLVHCGSIQSLVLRICTTQRAVSCATQVGLKRDGSLVFFRVCAFLY